MYKYGLLYKYGVYIYTIPVLRRSELQLSVVALWPNYFGWQHSSWFSSWCLSSSFLVYTDKENLDACL